MLKFILNIYKKVKQTIWNNGWRYWDDDSVDFNKWGNRFLNILQNNASSEDIMDEARKKQKQCNQIMQNISEKKHDFDENYEILHLGKKSRKLNHLPLE